MFEGWPLIHITQKQTRFQSYLVKIRFTNGFTNLLTVNLNHKIVHLSEHPMKASC